MYSAFFEFNVANSGLFAAKHGFETVGHNMANSATPGYSRQYVKQRASIPLNTKNGKGMVGTGTEVYGIGQIRDFYLDKKYWGNNATLGEYDTKKDNLNLLETVFNELSKTGMTSSVDDFFTSMNALTFSPGDDAYRKSVINIAESFAKNINNFATKLKEQQTDVNEDVYAVTQKINTIGTQIASLNRQIYVAELDGSSANDLRDQRALLVDELSSYANVEVKERNGNDPNVPDSKQFIVLLNGQSFVDHFNFNTLKCVPRENPVNENDALNLYDIEWSTGGAFNTKGLSGQLKGLLDLRDGDNGINSSDTLYKGIPHYINKLNKFVQTVAMAINEGKYADGTNIQNVTGHINGYDKDGEDGNLFFSYVKADGNIASEKHIDYSKLNAFNFTLSQALKDDPSNLATSKNPDSPESDNELILEIIGLKENNNLFKEGKISNYLIGVSSELAIDTKESTKFTDFYTDLVSESDNQRLQVSGVSLNEEMMAMVRYNQLYRASSKLISVINEIYNITINGLGV